jgi:Na+-transporting methylmalonyl-CoA/oxaloacetate decarboxylase beta subunit
VGAFIKDIGRNVAQLIVSSSLMPEIVGVIIMAEVEPMACIPLLKTLDLITSALTTKDLRIEVSITRTLRIRRLLKERLPYHTLVLVQISPPWWRVFRNTTSLPERTLSDPK